MYLLSYRPPAAGHVRREVGADLLLRGHPHGAGVRVVDPLALRSERGAEVGPGRGIGGRGSVGRALRLDRLLRVDGLRRADLDLAVLFLLGELRSLHRRRRSLTRQVVADRRLLRVRGLGRDLRPSIAQPRWR